MSCIFIGHETCAIVGRVKEVVILLYYDSITDFRIAWYFSRKQIDQVCRHHFILYWRKGKDLVITIVVWGILSLDEINVYSKQE